MDRANITWASGNDSILRVESGYLYPVSVGPTTVTATVEANGRTYTSNTCTVTVEANVADVIRASASVGSPLSFSSITSQLRGECQDVLGASLSYVSGLRVDTSQGTLYYHYQSEADTGAGVGTSENYYPYPGASQLALSDVTFVPKPDFSGTAVISYTGYASSSSFFQGTIEVRVEEAEDVSYSTSADRAIQFNADDFNPRLPPAAGPGPELCHLHPALPPPTGPSIRAMCRSSAPAGRWSPAPSTAAPASPTSILSPPPGPPAGCSSPTPPTTSTAALTGGE